MTVPKKKEVTPLVLCPRNQSASQGSAGRFSGKLSSASGFTRLAASLDLEQTHAVHPIAMSAGHERLASHHTRRDRDGINLRLFPADFLAIGHVIVTVGE